MLPRAECGAGRPLVSTAAVRAAGRAGGRHRRPQPRPPSRQCARVRPAQLNLGRSAAGRHEDVDEQQREARRCRLATLGTHPRSARSLVRRMSSYAKFRCPGRLAVALHDVDESDMSDILSRRHVRENLAAPLAVAAGPAARARARARPARRGPRPRGRAAARAHAIARARRRPRRSPSPPTTTTPHATPHTHPATAGGNPPPAPPRRRAAWWRARARTERLRSTAAPATLPHHPSRPQHPVPRGLFDFLRFTLCSVLV